jgi:hypothetical protein
VRALFILHLPQRIAQQLPGVCVDLDFHFVIARILQRLA